jgi:hypothetical protein
MQYRYNTLPPPPTHTHTSIEVIRVPIEVIWVKLTIKNCFTFSFSWGSGSCLQPRTVLHLLHRIDSFWMSLHGLPVYEWNGTCQWSYHTAYNKTCLLTTVWWSILGTKVHGPTGFRFISIITHIRTVRTALF